MTALLKVPFSGLDRQYHNLRQEILDATDAVLRSGQLMEGNHTAEFENWLARRNHSKYAVTLHSGTSALECLAEYYATGSSVMPPRVLIPTVTYAATANAFQRAGWDIHFADVDAYGVIDWRKIPDVSYQAIVTVGLYGHDVSHVREVKAWRNALVGNMTLIEDAAQHWLSANCERIGPAAISFDPMKNLACYGNGGAVVTHDSDLLHFARAWRNNGKTTHSATGTNSRMSELDCALMMVKTRYLEQWQRRRREIATYWTQRFHGHGIRCLVTKDNIRDHALHKFVIDVEQRDILQRNLGLRGIETRVHYQQPLHEIGTFRQHPGPDILSVGSALCRRVLSLPIYPELSDLQVEYVADLVLDYSNT